MGESTCRGRRRSCDAHSTRHVNGERERLAVIQVPRTPETKRNRERRPEVSWLWPVSFAVYLPYAVAALRSTGAKALKSLARPTGLEPVFPP
jgi:hypothetical protein